MQELQIARNHFLASLSADDLAKVQPRLKRVALTAGTMLFNQDDEVTKVYFPEVGVISIGIGFSGGQWTEAGKIGHNGVIGGGAVRPRYHATHQALVQVSGTALVADARTLTERVASSESLRNAFVQFDQMMLAQAQQAAGCNAVHGIETRLCRNLLHLRDLVMDDNLPVTQEILAATLGVNRTSVTFIAGRLQDAGLIVCRRGNVRILDAEALRDMSCECYDVVNSRLWQLVGWRPSFRVSPAIVPAFAPNDQRCTVDGVLDHGRAPGVQHVPHG